MIYVFSFAFLLSPLLFGALIVSDLAPRTKIVLAAAGLLILTLLPIVVFAFYGGIGTGT